MSAFLPRRFLGLRFTYYDDKDEELLDESLHYELARLEPQIRALCESFYSWEILDQDERSECDTRPCTSVWMPLDGMAGLFHRKDYPEFYRTFDLEAMIISEDTGSFMVFEDVTEFRDGAPFRYQGVAEADFELARLGIRARDRYRPAVGGERGTSLRQEGQLS